MIVSIVILSVITLLIGVYLIACLLHIKKIQKELQSLSEEQSTQNADIRSIAIHARDLTIAHNEIVLALNPEKQKPYVIKSYYGPPGNA
jgi:ABC-type uncharacterized transport system fused permease/ATPase subunit